MASDCSLRSRWILRSTRDCTLIKPKPSLTPQIAGSLPGHQIYKSAVHSPILVRLLPVFRLAQWRWIVFIALSSLWCGVVVDHPCPPHRSLPLSQARENATGFWKLMLRPRMVDNYQEGAQRDHNVKIRTEIAIGWLCMSPAIIFEISPFNIL